MYVQTKIVGETGVRWSKIYIFRYCTTVVNHILCIIASGQVGTHDGVSLDLQNCIEGFLLYDLQQCVLLWFLEMRVCITVCMILHNGRLSISV